MMDVLNEMGVQIASKDELYSHIHNEIDKTKKISHTNLIDVLPDQHHTKTTSITELTDHTKEAHDTLGIDHASLSNVLPDQHHTKTTSITELTDHDKTAHDALGIDHASLSNVLPDQHHQELHTLASHTSKKHSELTDINFNDHHKHALTAIFPASQAIPPTLSAATVTNRCNIGKIVLPFKCTVKGVIIRWGGTVAGNVKVGIYADNGDTPQGGALLASSDSVAKSGTDRIQIVPFTTPIQLEAGTYWIAYISDEATSIAYYGIGSYVSGDTDFRRAYYGATSFNLADPCPTVTFDQNPRWIGLAIQSVP
jgi:hypothetical protein